MSAPGQGDGDDDLTFEQAMAGVARIDGGPSRVERRERRRRRRPSVPAPASRLAIERWGEQVEGLAPGVDALQLARLRSGEIPVELKVDLHGLSEEAARYEVMDALKRARRAGLRCLLIIHGRGRRSSAGPVLKEALPGWLAVAPRVRAFTTAGPGLGGAGATLVLLRRSR